jgi:hypothetical protein
MDAQPSLPIVGARRALLNQCGDLAISVGSSPVFGGQPQSRGEVTLG